MLEWKRPNLLVEHIVGCIHQEEIGYSRERMRVSVMGLYTTVLVYRHIDFGIGHILLLLIFSA